MAADSCYNSDNCHYYEGTAMPSPELARLLMLWHLAEQGIYPPVPEPDRRGNRTRGEHITVAEAARIHDAHPRGIYRIRELQRRNPWLAQQCEADVWHPKDDRLDLKVSDALTVADRCVPTLVMAIERRKEWRPRKLTLRRAVAQIEAELWQAYLDAGLTDTDLAACALSVLQLQ